MRRKLLVLLAVVTVLAVMVAAPVSAKEKPISGKIELTFTPELCPSGLFVTWTGTVIIDGQEYAWVDYNTGLQEIGKFVYFEEIWAIFTLGEDPCNPGVLVGGTNTGWGPPGGAGKAEGTVEEVDSEGPFADVPLGSRMMWRGKVLGYPPADLPVDPGAEFKATFHIFP